MNDLVIGQSKPDMTGTMFDQKKVRFVGDVEQAPNWLVEACNDVSMLMACNIVDLAMTTTMEKVKKQHKEFCEH